MKIEHFEELVAWQKARELAGMVYRVTKIGDFRKDFGLNSQIRRAAGSVMHNIAEGFDAGGDKEFIRFLKYARRSASEVQSQAYLAVDLGYISQEVFLELFAKSNEVKKLINGFIGYLRRSIR